MGQIDLPLPGQRIEILKADVQYFHTITYSASGSASCNDVSTS